MTKQELRDLLVGRIADWNLTAKTAPRDAFNWVGSQAARNLGLPVVDCVLQQLSKLDSLTGKTIRREEVENMLQAIRDVAMGEAIVRLRLVVKQPVDLPGYATMPETLLEARVEGCEEGGDFKILDFKPPTDIPA